MRPSPLQVTPVGCDQIAGAHLGEIRMFDGAGPCAAQSAVPQAFDDLSRMLRNRDSEARQELGPSARHGLAESRGLTYGTSSPSGGRSPSASSC